MNREFEVHRLNEAGMEKVKLIASHFDTVLNSLTAICPVGRELAIVKTKLEEACFFAKKSIANESENQA